MRKASCLIADCNAEVKPASSGAGDVSISLRGPVRVEGRDYVDVGLAFTTDRNSAKALLSALDHALA